MGGCQKFVHVYVLKDFNLVVSNVLDESKRRILIPLTYRHVNSVRLETNSKHSNQFNVWRAKTIFCLFNVSKYNLMHFAWCLKRFFLALMCWPQRNNRSKTWPIKLDVVHIEQGDGSRQKIGIMFPLVSKDNKKPYIVSIV